MTNEDGRIESEVRRAMSGAVRDRFADGFEDRVVARWKPQKFVRAYDFGSTVVFQFQRTLWYAAAAAMILFSTNVGRHSTLARALGSLIAPKYPPTVGPVVITAQHEEVTLGSLYGLDALGGGSH